MRSSAIFYLWWLFSGLYTFLFFFLFGLFYYPFLCRFFPCDAHNGENTIFLMVVPYFFLCSVVMIKALSKNLSDVFRTLFIVDYFSLDKNAPMLEQCLVFAFSSAHIVAAEFFSFEFLIAYREFNGFSSFVRSCCLSIR